MGGYRRRTPPEFGLMAVVSATLVASCSPGEETRAYAVPNKICGISVAVKLVQPLLPPGQSIDAGTSLTGPDDTQRCAVMIDDDTAVEISGQRYPDALGVKDIALNYLNIPADELGQTNPDDSVMVWDSKVVGVAECTGYPTDGAGRNTKRYSITIESSYPDEAKARWEALQQFLPPYLTAAARTLGC
ncbi:hypothetical protein [Streptomyces spongiae]|uniref:DUF3558 domain-containing protein n=1 Tax=Streptomyces spongiae TaxID=565072 RepID=A0A5N8XPU9_9ACTN|nr:hypothetical protein [Streptomyces spongiae]MPY61411.1 hypothetical protein [Streptomyces spongiae]